MTTLSTWFVIIMPILIFLLGFQLGEIRQIKRWIKWMNRGDKHE